MWITIYQNLKDPSFRLREIETTQPPEQTFMNDPDIRIKHIFAKQNDIREEWIQIRKDFKNHAADYGIHPDALDTVITDGIYHYRIVGLKQRNRKYKILLMEENNENIIKTSVNFVKQKLPTSLWTTTPIQG